MKIFHIIGNGFDLNLGMRTSYMDFCKYYNSIETKSKNIKDLKKSIECDFETWSNLEIAFGNYVEKIKTTEEFDEIFEDLLDNLSSYLKYQEDIFDFTRANPAQLYNNLSHPEFALLPADRNQVKEFKNNWAGATWNVKVMMLNYTYSLEKLMNETEFNFDIGTHDNASKIILRGIEHIHGYHDKRMILGVNDISQLKNTGFHSNQDVLEAIIKTSCNKAYKHTVDQQCETDIALANLICIFGSSIGETDKYWWELIAKRLLLDCQLIIFTRGKETNANKGYKNPRDERKVKNKFLSLTTLNEDEKQIVMGKIFVGVNTDLFSKILNE